MKNLLTKGLILVFSLIFILLSAFFVEKFESSIYNLQASGINTVEPEIKKSAEEIDSKKTFKIKGEYNLKDLAKCNRLVKNSLNVLPADQSKALKILVYNFDPKVRRGLTGGSTIKLRCVAMSDAELVAVFIHEMGHIVDISLMNGTVLNGKSRYTDGLIPIFNDDLSLNFYNISWNSNKELKSSDLLNFVSTYAMTDPFEDFAESYTYYLLHGSDFKNLALTNDVLMRKYNFLKNYVFNGQEFSNENDPNLNLALRNYDTTVLAYNLNLFLNNN